MRGKRSDTHDVYHQGLNKLAEMKRAGIGTSKHADKHSGRGYDGKIYSDGTGDDYGRKWGYFCESMKAAGYKVNGHAPRTLEEAAGYMPQYIEELKSRPGNQAGTTMSAWSIRNYFAAAGKVLGLSAKDYELPARHTSEIRRSRGDAIRDAHFSESRNGELVTFASCTGLRNAKELQQICGTDLIERQDGSYAIHVQGKGGRVRESTIYGSPAEVKTVVDRMKAAGDGRVWSHVHSGADIHSYRAGYASRMYDAIARDPATIPASERYCCRGDNAGVWYDKVALMAVSEELGHSRCNVVVQHYLWQR